MKSLALIACAILILPGSLWAQEHSDITCSETAEMNYSYHTELLMHAYEIAKISPIEFENMRSKLVAKRESELQRCWQQYSADGEVAPQRAPAQEISNSSRAPASVKIQSPGCQFREPQRRGAFVEVVGAPEAEAELLKDEDGSPIYTGERISVGN